LHTEKDYVISAPGPLERAGTFELAFLLQMAKMSRGERAKRANEHAIDMLSDAETVVNVSW